jgi:hypothetical protein
MQLYIHTHTHEIIRIRFFNNQRYGSKDLLES